MLGLGSFAGGFLGFVIFDEDLDQGALQVCSSPLLRSLFVVP
jgi:hypothetical protein